MYQSRCLASSRHSKNESVILGSKDLKVTLATASINFICNNIIVGDVKRIMIINLKHSSSLIIIEALL